MAEVVERMNELRMRIYGRTSWADFMLDLEGGCIGVVADVESPSPLTTRNTTYCAAFPFLQPFTLRLRVSMGRSTPETVVILILPCQILKRRLSCVKVLQFALRRHRHDFAQDWVCTHLVAAGGERPHHELN